MWNMLLAVASEYADEYPKKIGLGEAAIDALLGFVVVFIGIAFLIAIVWLVGFIMRKTTGKAPAKKIEKSKEAKPEPAGPVKSAESEEPDEETIAVITAAIMAYYAQEKPRCEFTVKRIKRI